jgi:hypothetical protein
MTSVKPLIFALALCLLTACANTQRAADEAAQTQAVVDRAALEAEMEAERVKQEQLLAEERAREEATRAEAARLAEQQERARREAEAAARQAAVAAGSRNQGGDQRAAEIAKQQQRIAELRARIASNNDEAVKLDSANTSLKEAITAAESLSATLMAEQEKYAATDPATGNTQEPLAKSRIDELAAEVERLRAQAATLTGKTP